MESNQPVSTVPSAEKIFWCLEYYLERAEYNEARGYHGQSYYWMQQFNEMSMEIKERKIRYV